MSDTNRRVAVVVFVEVHDESADDRDAGFRAEAGLKAALAGEAALMYDRLTRKWNLRTASDDSKFVSCDTDLTVHGVVEVGLAHRSGLLWTAPTHVPFDRDCL